MLVAISIPIFTSQLEKAREATDAANIRSAYAEVVAAALTDDQNDQSATVTLIQTQNGWQSKVSIAQGNISTSISATNGASIKNDPSAGGTAVVSYDHSNGLVTIEFKAKEG